MLSCWSGAELKLLRLENKVLVYRVCDINVILICQLTDFQNENVNILLATKPNQRGNGVTVTPLYKYKYTRN